MSPELRKFLAEWLEWAEAGAPEHPHFRRWCGLCKASECWSRESYLRDELTLLFDRQGLDDTYPFGETSYRYARETERQHRSPTRLAWVRKQLESN